MSRPKRKPIEVTLAGYRFIGLRVGHAIQFTVWRMDQDMECEDPLDTPEWPGYLGLDEATLTTIARGWLMEQYVARYAEQVAKLRRGQELPAIEMDDETKAHLMARLEERPSTTPMDENTSLFLWARYEARLASIAASDPDLAERIRNHPPFSEQQIAIVQASLGPHWRSP